MVSAKIPSRGGNFCFELGCYLAKCLLRWGGDYNPARKMLGRRKSPKMAHAAEGGSPQRQVVSL
jgi:hypothetical protein